MEGKRLREFFLSCLDGWESTEYNGEKNLHCLDIFTRKKKSEAPNKAYTAFIFLVGRSSPCLDFVLCPNHENEINAGEKTCKRLLLFDFKILSLSIL